MRIRFMFVAVIMAIVGVAALPSRATAWGKEGHEIVGRIADKHLHSNARNAINELLEGHQFRSLSDGRLPNWADAIKSSGAYRRRFPKMNQWHYIDIDVDANLENLSLANFCSNGDCALDAIKKFQAILKDSTKPVQDRREALFFIAHIVGDIQQPLHCAERNNDKGGNLVKVHLPNDERHVTNLHRIWDTELVQEAMGPLTIAEYADRLTNSLSVERRKKYQKGTVEEWIIDGHMIARERVYVDQGAKIPTGGTPHTLSSDYVLDGAEIVEEQLTKGGVRLAKFLNDTFRD